jgi:anti-repressor protein
MNELISIKKQLISNTEVNAVNARELHQFLEVKSEFRNWIKNRIKEYDFIENQDFISNGKNLPNGGRSIEYYISIDMAKELSMVERNEKGRQARKYFIECEKRLAETKPAIPNFNNPAEAARAWAEQYEEAEKQKQINQENKPKVEFYDTVTQSETCFDLGTVSKLLNKGIGRNTLFAILRDKKILDRNNKPYQEYIKRGYFKIVENKVEQKGEVKVYTKTVAFQKGIDYINRLLEAYI